MKIKKFNEEYRVKPYPSSISHETHKQLYDLQTLVSNITSLQDIMKNDELKELAIELDKAAQKLITKTIHADKKFER